MTTWNPNQQACEQLISILNTTSNPDTKLQKHSYNVIEQWKSQPEFSRYLAYIFGSLPSINNQEYIRCQAGLILKNTINQNYQSITDEDLAYLKSQAAKNIGDPSANVRKICGIVITTILSVGSISGWPGLLEYLVNGLDSNDVNLVDGSFITLNRICEDHYGELDSDPAQPLDAILPKFLHFFNHPNDQLRLYAVNCINELMQVWPRFFMKNFDVFMQGYFFLASLNNAQIKKKVILAFLLITEMKALILKPYFNKVVEFMLTCQQSADEDIALVATDFWKIMSSSQNEKFAEDILKPYITQILNTQLTRMMYTQQDLIDIGETGEQNDNSHIPDKPEDIKPSHISRNFQSDEDDEENEYDTSHHWNLRKGAAEALESISSVFSFGILDQLLPIIQQGLQSNNWLARESSLLAIGCVSAGCYDEMKLHLKTIVPFLITLLTDDVPLIRSITCWTISRYSRWIFQNNIEMFRTMLQSLINRTKDKNKRVQRTSISALAAIIEQLDTHVEPYLEVILSAYAGAVKTFQRSNFDVLYDAISIIAEVLGPKFTNEKYLSIIMPPLLDKWNQLSDNDRDLLQLLECFGSIAHSLGPNFQQYAFPVFSRCLKLIEDVLVGAERHKKDENFPDPDREFLICSLDLLSSMFAALESKMEVLVANSKFIPLLIEVCKDPEPDFTQSAFALVGDTARHCIRCLEPGLPTVVPLLLRGVSETHNINSCNNAMWALGEIMVQLYGMSNKLMDSFVQHLLQQALQIFTDPYDVDLLSVCAAVLGRLGYCYPQLLAPHLHHIALDMSVELKKLKGGREKIESIKGFIEAIKLNPSPIRPALIEFCDMAASFYRPPQDLRDMFASVIHGFKNQLGERDWNTIFEKFSDHVKYTLKKEYGL